MSDDDDFMVDGDEDYDLVSNGMLGLLSAATAAYVVEYVVHSAG